MSRFIVLAIACALLLLVGCTESPKQKASGANNNNAASPNGGQNGQDASPSGNIQNTGPATPGGNSGDGNAQTIPTTPVVPKKIDFSGRWVGTLTEELHGPPESYPVGCTVEQSLQFDFRQSGSALSGTVTNVITKITGCEPAVPSSLIGFKTMGPISGTITGSGATFSYEDRTNLAASDFTATFSQDAVSGTFVTCHGQDKRCYCVSPDARCPGGYDANGQPWSGRHESVNWWTGDFSATRMN